MSFPGAAVSEVPSGSEDVSLSDVSELSETSFVSVAFVSSFVSEADVSSLDSTVAVVVCEESDSFSVSDFPEQPGAIRKTATIHPAKNRFI